MTKLAKRLESAVPGYMDQVLGGRITLFFIAMGLLLKWLGAPSIDVYAAFFFSALGVVLFALGSIKTVVVEGGESKISNETMKKLSKILEDEEMLEEFIKKSKNRSFNDITYGDLFHIINGYDGCGVKESLMRRIDEKMDGMRN